MEPRLSGMDRSGFFSTTGRKTVLALYDFAARLLLPLMDFLDRHPRLVRRFLRPVANAPILRKIIPVVVRAYMGSTAFDCHVVDKKTGWVIFGEVRETLQPGIFTRIVYDTLVERLGEAEGKDAIREIARESMYQEIKYGVEGKHVPGVARPLIGVPGILDEIRQRPHLLRLVDKGMNMVIRLIGDEGGWGRIRVSLDRDPIRIVVDNGIDVRHLAPSPEPVCVEYLALLEGATSYVTGEPCRAREVECAASGSSRCVFEVDRGVTP